MSSSKILKLYFIDQNDIKGKWKTILGLLVLLVAYELIAVNFMSTISKLYSSVASRDMDMFWNTLLYSVLIISVISLIKSLIHYMTDICSLCWRTYIMQYIHKFYTVRIEEILKNDIDGIDQRITQDVERLCTKSSQFLTEIIILPLVILFYSYFLVYKFGLITLGICLMYFTFGYMISFILSRQLNNLTYLQEQYEGEFRSIHIQYQLHCESIMLLRGQDFETKAMQMKYQTLYDNKQLFIQKSLILNIFTNFFLYAGSIVNYAVVGVAIIYVHKPSNAVDSEAERASKLAEGSYACLYLIGALSKIVSSIEIMREIQGLAERVCAVLNIIDDSIKYSPLLSRSNNVLVSDHIHKKDESGIMMLTKHQNYKPVTPFESNNVDNNDNIPELKYNLTRSYQQFSSVSTIFKIKNFDVVTEDGLKVLISKLNLEVNDGMRLLITGPSGCGKSTLLRLIATSCFKEMHYSSRNSKPQQQQHQQHSHNVPQLILNSNNINELEVCSQLPFCFKGTLIQNLFYPTYPVAVSHHNTNLTDYFGRACQYSYKLTNILQYFNITQNLQSDDVSLNKDYERCLLKDEDILPLENGVPPVPIAADTEEVLGLVGMDQFKTYLFDRVDCIKDWKNSISPGEQQRLAVARLLLKKPRLALLDEISSALDEATELALYTSIVSKCRTFISFGHRSSLRQFHSHELKINKDGTYLYNHIQ